MFNNKYIWNKPNSSNDKITMTVAMPILNGKDIIWLALDSLKNQTNINFNWELIIMEEYGLSRNTIKKYENELPGCVKIIHKGFDPLDIGIKKGKHKGKFPLISKWIWIAKNTSKNSEVFVLQAVDCYSSPQRLFIHNEHFKNKDCIFSSQPKGIFYNILTEQTVLYSASNNDKSKTHLNMALRTPHIKKYVHKNTPRFNKSIDRHLIDCILKNIGQKNLNHKNHYFDNSINKENWKYSLDTDGFNNISIARINIYDIINKKKNKNTYKGHMELWKNNNNHEIDDYIPKNILLKLKELKDSKVNEPFSNINETKTNIINSSNLLTVILIIILIILIIKKIL